MKTGNNCTLTTNGNCLNVESTESTPTFQSQKKYWTPYGSSIDSSQLSTAFATIASAFGSSFATIPEDSKCSLDLLSQEPGKIN